MRPFIIICHLLLLVYYAGFSQQPASSSGKCKQDLDVVEKAFSAFAADSIRKPDYYFKASKAAENILKTCGLNDEAKKNNRYKKNHN